MSERRGSNSRQPAWKAGALPTELLSHFGEANIGITIIYFQIFFNKKIKSLFYFELKSKYLLNKILNLLIFNTLLKTLLII